MKLTQLEAELVECRQRESRLKQELTEQFTSDNRHRYIYIALSGLSGLSGYSVTLNNLDNPIYVCICLEIKTSAYSPNNLNNLNNPMNPKLLK